MATENIVSKKYRILSDVANKVWDVISFFTLAKDVELTNGKNLETTCGSITGITSSLTSTSKTMAASASAIKQLNDKIADLNSNLSNSITIKSYTFSRPSGSGSTAMILDVTNYKKLSIESITYKDKGRLVITGDVSGTLYTIERSSGSGTITYNKELDISKDNTITITPTQHSSGDANNTLTVNNIVIGN